MAKDIIHDAVKNALIKDGWQITHDPFRMEYEEIEVFADLAAERSPIVAEKEGQKMVVEIKTFAGRSFIRQLQQALGEYSLYLDKPAWMNSIMSYTWRSAIQLIMIFFLDAELVRL